MRQATNCRATSSMQPAKTSAGSAAPQRGFCMSKEQELANAASMVLPSALLWLWWRSPPEGFEWNAQTLVMALGTVVHLPVSMTYHMQCALRRVMDPVDCFWRRMDQSCIHANCALFAWSLSGSALYFTANAALNARFVQRLWQPETADRSFERRTNILVAVVLFTLPMLWRRDFANYFSALFGCWGTAGVAFVFNERCGGWGHTAAHVLMGGFQAFLLDSASRVSVAYT